SFAIDDEGVPRYAVQFDGRPAVESSRLGFVFGDSSRFDTGVRVVEVDRRSFDETYTVPHGKASTIRNRFEEAAVTMEDAHGRQLVVELRAYDDGAAFRYVFPDRREWRRIEIADELTEFAVASDAAHWGLHLNRFDSHYEVEYDTGAVASIPDTTIMGLPALFNDGETWLAITEADLTDYAGMYVTPGLAKSTTNGERQARSLRAALSPRRDGSGLRVITAAPTTTPWRAILLGDHPGRLLESNLVLNLNDPVAIDTSWIKPGLAIDDWMTDHTVTGEDFVGAMDTRTMKHYIEFCGDYGLEYMSIDAGWYGLDYMDSTLDLTRTIPEIDMPELVRFAKERGVDIFVWTLGSIVMRQMDEAFAQFREWGVKGANIDFLESDDQETVAFVNEATRKAAEYGLHVEFHGVYKPTGIERTYPNLLAHEAVLGLEYSKWSALPTPEHNTTIPFIRMLAGPMDYLPGGFTNATRESFEIVSDHFMTMGTRAHSLAQLVIFESGFQVLPDYPGNYRAKLGSEFLKHVPAAWDETRVLAGYPGDFIVIARRSGEAWFIGANTDWTARTVEVSLDFLGPGEHNAEIYADGPNAANDANDIVFETRTLSQGDTLRIDMAPGGGMAARMR
ncbi:MAG TPA: glycoside hydrolase family 97 protein, partial [Rhodothermales bacterium]